MIMVIKNNLKEILKEKNISQKTFAQMCGLREATINEICNQNKQSINKKHLSLIASTLGIENIQDIITIQKN